MIFGVRSGFASVGGEQPGEKVGEELGVLRVYCSVLEFVGRIGKGIGLERVGLAGGVELEKTELAEVGDQDEAILLEIPVGLGIVGECFEIVVSGLDFDYAALGVLEEWRFGGAGSP